MKRRDFIKKLPLGIAAAAVPFSVGGLFSGKAFGRSSALDALLNSQSDTDKVLVIINLQGGNDGLNTVIPFDDSLYRTNRKDIGYISSAEIAALTPYQVRGDLALNPPLGTDFNNLFKSNKLAIIQNVGYADPNRSHFRATDIWNTASDSELVLSTGWMGRYLETQEKSNYPLETAYDDPIAMAIDYSTSLVFQGSKAVMASAVVDPSKYNPGQAYIGDTPPLNNYGYELNFLRGVLSQSNKYGARFTSVFGKTGATTNKAAYPINNPLAAQLQKVAWCINGGLKTRVYFVSLGGFDTHINQYTKDPTQGQGLLHKYLGEAVSAFQSDMEQMGLADRVIGMTYSEFGRRVNQNGSNGTDHGTAAPMFLFGAQINGELYGDNPKLDAAHLDQYGDLIADFDFRKVYAALLTQWFGVDDSLRKSILNQSEFTTTGDFKDAVNGFQFPVNGSSLRQDLIKNPANSVGSSSQNAFTLYQNSPNPFRGLTTISFALSESSKVLLEVFDSRGSLISTVTNGYLSRGKNEATFDGRHLPSGTYYFRLEVAGKTQTRQMTLIK
jgi:uncharacterized protein (DUF1501 family)